MHLLVKESKTVCYTVAVQDSRAKLNMRSFLFVAICAKKLDWCIIEKQFTNPHKQPISYTRLLFYMLLGQVVATFNHRDP